MDRYEYFKMEIKSINDIIDKIDVLYEELGKKGIRIKTTRTYCDENDIEQKKRLWIPAWTINNTHDVFEFVEDLHAYLESEMNRSEMENKE